MANRRKFLAGLGALATGSAAAMGTGAFNSAEVDRSMTVATANDEGSLLALEPLDSDVAELGTDGNLALNFTGRDSDDEPYGLNAKANIIYNDVFRITNNFQETVAIAVGSDGERVYGKSELDDSEKDRLGLIGDNTDIALNSFTTGETGYSLDAGNSGLGAVFLNSANRVRVTEESIDMLDSSDPSNFEFNNDAVENNDKFLAPGESATVSLQFITGPDPTLDADSDESEFFDGERTDIAILAATAEQVWDTAL